MTSLHRRLVLVAVATIAVDLASKLAAVRWLTDPVDLGVITVRATENSGVAFGLGADQPFALVAALTSVVVAAIAVGAWRGFFGGPVGAGLIVGGGAANLTDRHVGGSVVDLFDLGWWPVFNVADVALTVVVAVTVAVAWHEDRAVRIGTADDARA